jgi:hypothetical protein
MKIFNDIGIVAGVIVYGCVVYLGIMSISYIPSRYFSCGPNKTITLPLARAIVKHIEKKGLPNSMEEIENLPYLLHCKDGDAGKYINQVCSFKHNEEQFLFKVEISNVSFKEYMHIGMMIRYDIEGYTDYTRVYHDASYYPKENKIKSTKDLWYGRAFGGVLYVVHYINKEKE